MGRGGSVPELLIPAPSREDLCAAHNLGKIVSPWLTVNSGKVEPSHCWHENESSFQVSFIPDSSRKFCS